MFFKVQKIVYNTYINTDESLGWHLRSFVANDNYAFCQCYDTAAATAFKCESQERMVPGV